MVLWAKPRQFKSISSCDDVTEVNTNSHPLLEGFQLASLANESQGIDAKLKTENERRRFLGQKDSANS